MGLLERRTPKGSAPPLYSPDGERYCPLDSDIMLRIVILACGSLTGEYYHKSHAAFISLSEKENITPGKARNITLVHCP